MIMFIYYTYSYIDIKIFIYFIVQNFFGTYYIIIKSKYYKFISMLRV